MCSSNVYSSKSDNKRDHFVLAEKLDTRGRSSYLKRIDISTVFSCRVNIREVLQWNISFQAVWCFITLENMRCARWEGCGWFYIWLIQTILNPALFCGSPPIVFIIIMIIMSHSLTFTTSLRSHRCEKIKYLHGCLLWEMNKMLV